ARDVSAAIQNIIDARPPDDRLILQLRFESGMTVPQIARALNVGQRLLYRRIEARLREVRKQLERSGIGSADVTDLIGQKAIDFSFRIGKAVVRPSTQSEGAIATTQEDIP